MNFIGIDIGATFIKSATLDLEQRKVLHRHAVRFPEFLSDPLPFRLVDPAAVVSAVIEEIEAQLAHGPADGIVMTGQMGGMILVQDGDRQAPYISWQDQRCHQPMNGGLMDIRGSRTYFDVLQSLITPEEVRELGELVPCTPICHLHWLQNNWKAVPKAMPCSLPDYVAWRLSGNIFAPGFFPVTDCTFAAAIGLFDIIGENWNEKVICKLGLQSLRMPIVVNHGNTVSEYKDIPIFTPVGDHQCSLLGAGLCEGEVSINIGTGSQVSMIASMQQTEGCQVRPYFGGKALRCVTHIPAGRALNCLMRLVLELSDMSEDTAWAYINEHVSGRRKTDLRWNLNFWPFKAEGGASLQGMFEDNFNVPDLFLAAFREMTKTYAEAKISVGGDKPYAMRLSGGLLHKIPALRHILKEEWGFRSSPFTISSDPDETLTGLLACALAWSGRESSEQSAANSLRERETA